MMFVRFLAVAWNDDAAGDVYREAQSTMIFVMPSESETPLDVSAPEIIRDSSTALGMTEG
jgi:hypothetical protein